MHLIQLLLPLQDGNGKPFEQQKFERLSQDLTERFGGLTSYSRSPAEGRWKGGAKTEQDDILVLEVMTDDLDRAYWASLRERLEQEFRQDEIIIRAQRIERL